MSILSYFPAATFSLNFRSGPTKIVQSSLIIVIGLPLCAKNCITAFNQMPKSIFGKISIYKDRTASQVNKKHQRFSFRSPIFTVKRAKAVYSNICKNCWSIQPFGWWLFRHWNHCLCSAFSARDTFILYWMQGISSTNNPESLLNNVSDKFSRLMVAVFLLITQE